MYCRVLRCTTECTGVHFRCVLSVHFHLTEGERACTFVYMSKRTTKPAAKPTETRRAVAYLRVSTDEQALGPEAQRAAIAAWARARGVEIVAEYADFGVSGAAEVDARPGLLAAVAALKSADALIVAKRDRLARSLFAAAMIERLAEKAGARILSADGVGEGDGPEAEMMRGMLDVFAQYERALIRTRTKVALAAKADRGERVSGHNAYGLTDADAPVLEAVRALRAEGLSVRAIAAELQARGFTTRKGTPLGATQVQRLLAREAA